jgi:tetratricopeptide (TPR) repeat protein
MPTLSVCMIVKDEAEKLDRALSSVTGLADELIVVDTGSSDATVEVALAQDARVFHQEWRGDFARARNQSLAHASGEWILVLDADEALDADSGRDLKPFLAETCADAATVIVRNLTADGDLLEYVDSGITRLFRNRPAFRYEGQIHEQIRPCIERQGGRIAASGLIIWHHGYAGPPEAAAARSLRNLALLKQALVGAPQDAYLHYQTGSTYKSFGVPELAYRHLTAAIHLDDGTLTVEARHVAYMKLAQLAYAASRHEEALRHARSSLSLHPHNTPSLYVAALASLELGDIPRACGYFEMIRTRHDIRPEHLAQAETLLRHLQALVRSEAGHTR